MFYTFCIAYGLQRNAKHTYVRVFVYLRMFGKQRNEENDDIDREFGEKEWKKEKCTRIHAHRKFGIVQNGNRANKQAYNVTHMQPNLILNLKQVTNFINFVHVEALD